MRARLPMMVQDPEIAAHQTPGEPIVEGWTMLDQDHFLDGPVTPRVAVIDLDPDTEHRERPVPFDPPGGGQRWPHYRVADDDVDKPAFIAVSAFATVWRTIRMFEEPGTLAREISWGFGAPQLLVVPRAGWLENAYYERASHSLQFFQFKAGRTTIYTALSRDIVAHETAHAVIDGIDPDLYDALDPQALALHEGIADLTAVLLAFESWRLRPLILDATHGRIDQSNAFSSIGEQFGRAIDPQGKAGWLRNLLNDRRIDPNDEEIEPHALSEVISGLLYELLVEIHEFFKEQFAPEFGGDRVKASGKALYVAGKVFQKLVFRGLDYLPPGEVTFADFGCAILAADLASPGERTFTDSLRQKLVARGVVADPAVLDIEVNVADPAVESADLQGLVDSEWVAYRFADRNRALLGIPDDAEFEILPRVVVDGRVKGPEARAAEAVAQTAPVPPDVGAGADEAAAGDGDTDAAPIEANPAAPSAADGDPVFRELLFKVRWSQVEPNPPGVDPPRRRVQTGTTMVIDWHAKAIRALRRPLDFEGRRTARDAMLLDLLGRGIVDVTGPAERARGARSASGIDAVDTSGILRVKQTARLLHVVAEAVE